mmetsp:Transcript_17792/g.56199  ORF Transcript_17792/g.56199 Transcript_17792/m.56199 type:complete len:308 (-) Transcript_17792:1457-2380(-)
MGAGVEFKFKSDHGYSTHDLAGAESISIAELKQVITALKNVPAAFGLILTNAQTGEEYGDDASLVTDGSRLMVRRVPISRLSASSAGGTASAGNLCVISPAACNALPAGSDPSVEACPLRSLSVCGSIARRSLSSGSMVLCGCTRASEACLQDYAQGECCTCKTLFLSLWRSRCPPKHHSALMLRTPEHQPAAAIWRPQRMCIAACGHARSPLCATAPLPRSLSRLRTALCAKHPDPNQTPSSRLSQLMYVQRGRSTCADGDISSTSVRKTDINTIRLPQHRRLRHFNNGYGVPGKASLEHSPLPRG